jgi:fluoride exporter
MYKLVLIALGGLVGTLSRYALSTWVDERALSLIPYGTIVVNLAGCFVAGFLFPLMEKFAVAPELRLAVFTGFLGGFTTFSAYALQSIALARSGALSTATANVLISNIVGLMMVWLGGGLSRSLVQ